MFEKQKKNIPHWTFCLLFIHLIGFLMLQFPFLFTSRLWPDEALYASYARNIADNPFYIFSPELAYPPLMPLMISFGSILSPDLWSFRLMILMISVIGIYAIYRLGGKIDPLIGLFSAIGLTYIGPYFSYSSFLLIDQILAVFFILLGIQLYNVNSSKVNRIDFFVGLLCALIGLLKWSGFLAAVWVACYYLFGLTDIPLKDRLKKLFLPMALFSSSTIVLIVKNMIHLGRLFPSVTALRGAYFVEPSYFYYFFKLASEYPYTFIPFLLIGIGCLAIKKNALRLLILWWFLPYVLIVSVAGEKDTRYILPILPCLSLVLGIGITVTFKAILKKISYPFRFPLIVTLSVFVFMSFMTVLIEERAFLNKIQYAYVGFEEAGNYIAERLGKGVVIAGSDRAMRLYTGIGHGRNENRLYKIPSEKSDFERIINQEKANDIFLVIDRWEYTQPDWIDPENNTYLDMLKFKLIQEVRFANHPVFRNEPVVWIFHRVCG